MKNARQIIRQKFEKLYNETDFISIEIVEKLEFEIFKICNSLDEIQLYERYKL